MRPQDGDGRDPEAKPGHHGEKTQAPDADQQSNEPASQHQFPLGPHDMAVPVQGLVDGQGAHGDLPSDHRAGKRNTLSTMLVAKAINEDPEDHAEEQLEAAGQVVGEDVEDAASAMATMDTRRPAGPVTV